MTIFLSLTLLSHSFPKIIFKTRNFCWFDTTVTDVPTFVHQSFSLNVKVVSLIQPETSFSNLSNSKVHQYSTGSIQLVSNITLTARNHTSKSSEQSFFLILFFSLQNILDKANKKFLFVLTAMLMIVMIVVIVIVLIIVIVTITIVMTMMIWKTNNNINSNNDNSSKITQNVFCIFHFFWFSSNFF